MIEYISAVISYILPGSWIGTLLLVLCLILGWKTLERPKGIPPGPRGLPLIGYLPFYYFKSKKTLLPRLQKTYGSIFSMYFGDQLVVFLQDYESVQNALVEQGDVFSGRPKVTFGVLFPDADNALGSSDGKIWREQRRFSLNTLRDFGAGKSSMELQILDEINYFLEEVSKQKSQPFDIHQPLSKSVSNNISTVEFGKRFEYDDPQFLKLLHMLDLSVPLYNKSTIVEKYPWLRNIPFTEKILHCKQLTWLYNENKIFSQEMIDEHRKNFVPGKNDSFIDAYFNEQLHREKTNDEPGIFNERILNANLRNFFAAGTETTTTSLKWSILFMMLHPDVQRHVQQEIDDVIGRERTPTSEDRLKMPYTEATLLEVARRGSVIPFNVPHRNLEETSLNGYRIPLDTMIITNLYAIHHDEKLFPDPFSFRPERFINEHGQFVKSEHVIPFSLGKRFCIGEPLARMELFLYFTSMLQKFTFKNPEGQVLTTESEPDFVNSTPHFKVQAMPRN